MEYREVVLLSDEDGSELEFERLDLIPYNNKQYAVLMAVKEGDLLILQVQDSSGQDDTLYDEIEDEQVLQAVFQQFKDRHATEYSFSD